MASPLMPSSEKPFNNSLASSLIEDLSKLNTEETKKSEDLSENETHHSSEIDRFDYYAKFNNQKKLRESKISGHICEIEEKYNILQFC